MTVFAGGYGYEVEFAYGPLDFDLEPGTIVITDQDVGEVMSHQIGEGGFVAKKIPGYVVYPVERKEA